MSEDKKEYKPKERHLIGLFVQYEFILDMLFAEPGDNRIYINHLKDIPDNAKVKDVRETYERQGFLFILEHPSFPLVDPGAMMEIRNLAFELELKEPELAED